MTITGKNLIAGEWTGDTKGGFTAFDAVSHQAMTTTFADATDIEVNTAINRANDAFISYSQTSPENRAHFLRTIGEQISALGDELVTTACAETGLPAMRIQGERGRTIGQLNLFADLLEKGEYDAVIDLADNDRQPLPKPDTRLGYLPLGVVGVFAASNFPLAFSTAGGDTASALAAGCPVVMKAHAAHPATAELVAQAILKAIDICDVDKGVFSLIQGKNYAIASQIVTHPHVKAVGFTGSERVGMILQQQINQRPEPIPFYGELGSINPQYIMPEKLAQNSQAIAQGLVGSLMMGQGQFCTSPGVWVVIGKETDDHYQSFTDAAAKSLSEQAAGVMLTPAMCQSYTNAIKERNDTTGVTLVATGLSGREQDCSAALFATDFATYESTPTLHQELFGFSALIVRCDDFTQMMKFTKLLTGNLTASIHALDADLTLSAQLSQTLVHKVGRLIYNQMPTGVEVCASMNHGGPFPASTNIRTTSVGSEAIKRFQRPICYQNMPQALLPKALQN
ncbi:MAG: aldehyde dehydrogenase (NADP(+)) [Colwellia sp.]|nr:aldehyde dehydrogenase (NADP(+)) [Colwellia sp.]MCW8863346.1 aldehyde dehydrogenase (NADP(+)) [Colwellia sp.]MCW9080453.1 aldehyde dehydrogenase (NADP(+)) [Colwellia sp.]